jgi:hypothetical protein
VVAESLLKGKEAVGMSQGFFDAIKAGDLAKIEELLLVDPNLASTKSEWGTSAILVAAYNNRAEIASVMSYMLCRVGVVVSS